MPSFKSYLSGFILSVFFSILAFVFVMQGLLTGTALIAALILLAVVQAWVQLTFFLHLGQSSWWSKIVLFSTMSIIFILVVGSLWIMNHLNYNHSMTDQEIMHEEGIHKYHY
jgi:cytochrome o ubiquinol oxidase subunit IV